MVSAKSREEQLALDCYASAKEIAIALGISESKWKRDVKAGIYPKPRDFGGRTKRWKISDINECVENFPQS